MPKPWNIPGKDDLAGHTHKMTAGGIALALALGACSPTVKVQAPDKPIVINLNVKIEQEVRIRVEQGVEDLLTDNPDIF